MLKRVKPVSIHWQRKQYKFYNENNIDRFLNDCNFSNIKKRRYKRVLGKISEVGEIPLNKNMYDFTVEEFRNVLKSCSESIHVITCIMSIVKKYTEWAAEKYLIKNHTNIILYLDKI